jgi:hypothetical protein
VTPLKIPRLNFPAKKPKIQKQSKRKKPHPHKDQKLFVKIESKLTLIKHNGLATSSRKIKHKNSAKNPLLQTNLQTPITPLDQPTNPNNQRRRSENFEEKLRLFQHPNSSPRTSPNKSTTSTDLENKKPETKSQHTQAKQQQNLKETSKKSTVVKEIFQQPSPEQSSTTAKPPARP